VLAYLVADCSNSDREPTAWLPGESGGIMKSATASVLRRFVVLAACLLAMNAQAVPASPEPFVVKQPGGTSFYAVMQGDEFQGWAETLDGYTIVKNAATGYFEYARHNAAGELVPSGIVVAPAFAAQMMQEGLLPPKGLRPPRNTALEQFQERFLKAHHEARMATAQKVTPTVTGTWAPTPVTGPKKILIILVSFADVALTSTPAYWSNAVHDLAGASVARYYQDNSFSNISIAAVPHTQPGGPTGVVSVTLGTNHPNCGGSCSFSTESAWINAALAAAAPYVNFAALDTNGNGTISVDEALIYFVLAGFESSAGASTPGIWAHAWGGPGVAVSGKNVDHWALNGERYNATEIMRMGVIAHEMGHAMGGLPDLYDISGKNQGLGIFSLMAGGSWGRKSGEIGGTTPVGLDAWARHYLGWSTPQYPSDGASVTFVSGLASKDSAVMLLNPATSSSEYWLVENRPPTNWDGGMYPNLGTWTGGLLIQHIDLNVGTKSGNSFNSYTVGPHQGNLAVEPSTATCSLKAVAPATSSRGCPTILYYNGNSTTFNGASTPNSNYYSGATSSVGVSGVSLPGSTMTATVQNAGSVPGTFALTVSTTGGGTGTVTSSVGGINCGATCAANYSPGTVVTLTATGTGGSSFDGWSGACTGIATCQVTMDQAKSVTASFGVPVTPLTNGVAVNFLTGAQGNLQFFYIDVPTGTTSLTVQTSGGTGDVDLYVRRDVQPNTTTFDCQSWVNGNTESCPFTSPVAGRYYVMLHAYAAYSGVSLVATYVGGSTTTYSLTVAKTGTGAGSATISSSPAGISCGATCSASFASGMSVTVYANAPAGFTFVGWTGDCTGSSLTCPLAMTAARSATATFMQNTYNITTAANPAAGGTVSCSPNPVGYGGSSTCTATANSGYTFSAFSGDCTGSTCSLSNVTADKSVTANFVSTSNPPRLSNISTRGRVLTGNDVMIGGFVIGGSTAKTVLVRARGPSMIPAGVTDALTDPQLTLVNQATGTVIGTNDNWGSASNASAISATGKAPTNAFESAILMSLQPGAYTALVNGTNNGIGVGIIEVFEIDGPQVPLTNISTRGQVQTGNNVMIGGFVIDGSGPQQVLIRARGPSMIPAGVTNAMADPTMSLVSQATGLVIATNDNWGTASNAAAITATGKAPTSALESAILTTLSPGAYTVIVSGVNNGVGVGIIEVFAQ
jgi:M6 family metalloprotease-like protein/uncharacterized repeat protein (TIGR02543 family)